MSREVLDHWCERGILALVLAILVFAPLAMGAVRAIDFAVVEFLTVGALLLWGCRLWLSPRPKLLKPAVCWAVLAFAGYAVARYLTSDVEYVARQEMIQVVLYACLFFVVLNNLHRQESVSVISFTMIFLAMGIAGYAVYQFLTGSDLVWQFAKNAYKNRGSGTFYSPNHLGGFLEMLLPLALAYTVSGRVKALTRVFVGYAAGVIIAGIVVTLSRGAWISTLAALAVLALFLIFERRYRIPTLLVVAVILVAGVFVVPRSFQVQSRVLNLVQADGRVDSDLRFTLWEPAFQMWQDHPWWGVGPAHYNLVFRAYRPQEVQLQPDRAHNDYVNTLADWGAVGTLLVGAAWALLAGGLVKTWRSVRGSGADLGPVRGSNKYAFVIGGAVGLVAILCHSVVDFNMHIPANALVVTTLFALLSSHLRFVSDRYWAGARLWLKVPGTVLLLGAAVYLAQQGYRGAAEFRWLKRAAAAPAFSAEKIGYLKKAYAIEPMNPDTTYAIGEAYRVQSSEGGTDYAQLAASAMEWYKRGMDLNKWDGYNYLRYGMCLDWVDREAESRPYFDRANELDPSGYFTAVNTGLHFVELGDYAAAKPWFERSKRLQWVDNQIATNYLEIATSKLLESATNDLKIQLRAGAF